MDLFALATLPAAADEAGGPPSIKFYELRDNLVVGSYENLAIASPLASNTALRPGWGLGSSRQRDGDAAAAAVDERDQRSEK